MTDRKIRVVVADDHPVVRAGVAAFLGQAKDLEVVGEAADGLEALALTASSRPDVVLVDLMLPGLSGLEVTRRLAEDPAGPRIVVLTLHANDAYAVEAFAAGAAAYLTKDAAPSEILRVIREVANGRIQVPPRLRGVDGPGDPWMTLTAREREVAQLVGEGHSSADIGLRLGISGRTVEVHRSNALRKLAVSGTPELVRYLVRRGIVSAED